MAALMLSHGSLMWLSDAANPDNTVSCWAAGRSMQACPRGGAASTVADALPPAHPLCARCSLTAPPASALQELKSRLVAEPVVIRVLEQSLGHPTMVELRLLALDVAEFLSRVKCDRQPLYRLIPTAARWAANPAKPARAVGPVMPGVLRPGQSMEQAMQTGALSLLTNLLDRWAGGLRRDGFSCIASRPLPVPCGPRESHPPLVYCSCWSAA